jgi:hypothetical protein
MWNRYFCIALIVCAASTCEAGVRFRWSRPSRRLETAKASRVLRKDAVRDAATKPVRLSRSRTVARYTTGSQARLEMRSGIAPRSHFASRARAGRPFASVKAGRTFGLPRRPTVRESVVLRRGTVVRFNKALGGRPGMGEITTLRRVPKENIRRIVRLKR